MSTELNNHENQEQEDPRLERRNKRTYLYWAKAGAAVAAVGATGKANADELLLCTYYDSKTGIGTVVDDPESNNDQDPVPDNSLDFGTSQRIYKDYILKPFGDWIVFKKVNGQDVQVGKLDGVIGSIGFITDSGVATSGGKFYKITDTGETLVSEYVGENPASGLKTNFGGYIFASHSESDGHVFLTAISEADILNHTGSDPIPTASIREISTDSSAKKSKGIDADHLTNELVISLKQGAMKIDLTQLLDENGQLPQDFSLDDVALGEIKNFPSETIMTVVSSGYGYHLIKGGEGIIIQPPSGDPITMTKDQLGAGAKIKAGYGLNNGGIYILFEDVPDGPSQTPVVLHESGEVTQDPGPMPSYFKTCFVVAPEDQYLFQPAADPCAEISCNDGNACTTDTCANENGQAVCDNTPNVGQTCDDQAACTVNDKCDLSGDCAGTPKTCPAPVNQCEQSAGCDANTGSCLVENKTDGTLCNDGNIGTENDQCVSGVCQGAPIVNPEPNPEPEPDVVELNPEADVVEQGPDTVEQGNEVVEQEEITTEVTTDIKPGDTSDTSDTGEDVAEDLTGDNGDTGDAAEEDTTEDTADNDNANPELDTHDALYVEGEDATEIAAETNAETQEVIAEKDHPKKSPGGCGCNTANLSPDSMSGTLLLGAMLIGLAANMRYKILEVLAKRR